MKFDCDSRRLRREEKEQARKAARLDWHPFFAVLPVKVGLRDCRIMEKVERRFVPIRRKIGPDSDYFIEVGHRTEYRPYGSR